MVLTYLFVIFAAISNILADNNNEWNSRNLESHFTRFGSRIDQVLVRLDHLDSRINRFTSLVQGRLDSVENSLTTTKLRMDLWAEELSRIEEQLTRKWKNLENKFDLMTSSIDSKLESKLTLIQRDNRRHNEHLSNSFLNLGQRLENSNDKIALTLSQNHVNTSLLQRCSQFTNYNGNSSMGNSKETKLLTLLEDFENKSSEVIRSGSALTLVSGKVSNMFDDLIQRSDIIQAGIKETLSVANLTRREIQDSLRVSQLKMRAVATTGESSNGNGALTSSETMCKSKTDDTLASTAAVIIEALASVESMSTALGRRMAELGRSIDERFEMVQMTLNGFLESCVRIQDGAPLIEEHIAAILEKLLDSFDNNTKTSHDELFHISEKLDSLLNGTCASPTFDELFGQFVDQDSTTSSTSTNNNNGLPDSQVSSSYPDSNIDSSNTLTSQTAEILKNSPDLTEDEKKSLWESFFRNDKTSISNKSSNSNSLEKSPNDESNL